MNDEIVALKASMVYGVARCVCDLRRMELHKQHFNDKNIVMGMLSDADIKEFFGLFQ